MPSSSLVEVEVEVEVEALEILFRSGGWGWVGR